MRYILLYTRTRHFCFVIVFYSFLFFPPSAYYHYYYCFQRSYIYRISRVHVAASFGILTITIAYSSIYKCVSIYWSTKLQVQLTILYNLKTIVIFNTLKVLNYTIMVLRDVLHQSSIIFFDNRFQLKYTLKLRRVWCVLIVIL